MTHVDHTVAPLSTASAYGYSTKPQVPREARAALKNRETRELVRLHGGGIPIASSQADPFLVDKRSPLYGGPHERLAHHFMNKTEPHDAERRAHRERVIDNLKWQRVDRDVKREEARVAEVKRWDEDGAKLAGTGLRNRSSVGYNLVDGRWGDEGGAVAARYQDQMVEYRARMRTQHLDRRGNSDFNVITNGERRVLPTEELRRPPAPPGYTDGALVGGTYAGVYCPPIRPVPRGGSGSQRS
jgi:hypothetical protein